MTRTEFLREQTLSGENKKKRAPLPQLTVADLPYSLPERKALALKKVFDTMPIFIGERELIVGTRTLFAPKENNKDGHSISDYKLYTDVTYLREEETEKLGNEFSYLNKTHFTPDFDIILDKGIDGIINEAEQKKKDSSLNSGNIDFLSSVIIAYSGLKNLILRYVEKAAILAEKEEGERRTELLRLESILRKISSDRPDSFYEAVQLLWFAHLGTIIESFELVCYGRLDVILGKFLKDTPKKEAQQLIECLLLKMYDQTDLSDEYLGEYSAQLVVTLGGVLPDGSNAVNDVTMMFLDAIDKVRLPDPEFNLRISTENPPEFLDRAASLTVSGCNYISYYNDDLFVESLTRAGILVEYARDYGFDLCQDINIPGKGDFWVAGFVPLARSLMCFLEKRRDYKSFEELIKAFKASVSYEIKSQVEKYNIAEEHLDLYAKGDYDTFFDGVNNHGKPAHRYGCTPVAPLPFLSGLYHGCVENALDVIFEPYPLKDKGFYFGESVETINSLAAIKKTVYEEKRFTLDEIYFACESDFEGEKGTAFKNILWNCPKWGNDDDFVDSIAKELLEFCLGECGKYKTYYGGQVLGGIHQPHPVPSGKRLRATPEGRAAFSPVSVTLTPESGTMKNGPTAALCSASKINPMLIQWNYCVMVNYFASVFKGNGGKEVFKTLLNGYFERGGMQHQPNISDAEELRKAQLNPEKYKDLVVRLWGVSAHFVNLPKAIQDEMIARFS